MSAESQCPNADTRAAARALRTLARGDAAANRRLTILTVLHTACVAAWALALTLVLVQAASLVSLLSLAAATAGRAWVSRAISRAAAWQAFAIKSRLRRQTVTAALGGVAVTTLPPGAVMAADANPAPNPAAGSGRSASATTAPGAGSARSTGATMAAVVDEIDALDGYFSQYRPAELDARIGPVLIAAAVAPASPVAAAILLATLVPFAAVMALAGGAASIEATRQFDALARLSGHFVDRVRALPVILAFQAEQAETARVATAAREVSRRTMNVLRVAFISSAALEFFAAISVAIVAVYCGFALLGLLPFEPLETLAFPTAFYALALAPEFYAPLRRLAAAYHEKQLGEAAAARLLPLWDALPARAGASSAGGTRQTGRRDRGTLTARRPEQASASMPESASASVSASESASTPPPKSAPAVHYRDAVVAAGELEIGPINLDAPAAALTVVRGPTGAGKSTLLAALLGRAPLKSGAIAIGETPTPMTAIPDTPGQAPATVDSDTTVPPYWTADPARISWAGQAPVFLPGTILENLMAAAPGTTRDAALAMAMRVGLGPALERRPLGGDTLLDERGSGLSGGERRRLALARALLKPAPLLLLDEPTAELDDASEQHIVQLIREAARDRTVIAATHSDALAAAAACTLRLA